MKDSDYVKRYFKSHGTVAIWWNPTEGDFAQVYEIQMQQVKIWIKKFHPRTCLEISCGKGRVTKEIAPLCAHYIASDISQEMLAIARARIEHVHFVQEDAEKLAHPSESVDGIVCLEALVHYPKPDLALREFHRVLRKGGVVIIDSDNKYSLRRLVKRTYSFVNGEAELGIDIFNSYSKKELVDFIQGAGFLIEEFKYMGVASPIRIRRKNGSIQVLSVNASKQLQDLLLDSVPLVQNLATYHLVLARKI